MQEKNQAAQDGEFKKKATDKYFEKDISESVGFTNGFKLWEDLVDQKEEINCSLLGLICALNFFERIDKIYDEAYQNFEGQENVNMLMKNLLYIS